MEAKRWISNRKQEGIQEVRGAFPLEAPDDERARQEGLKMERVTTWNCPSSLFQTKLVVVTGEQREDAGFLPAFPGVPWEHQAWGQCIPCPAQHLVLGDIWLRHKSLGGKKKGNLCNSAGVRVRDWLYVLKLLNLSRTTWKSYILPSFWLLSKDRGCLRMTQAPSLAALLQPALYPTANGE